jgi:hypothetical protein
MQARRFKTLLQTSVLFILPVALIPGQITAAEPADAETTTTTGEAGATESDPGAWDKTREVSGEVWEATKEGSAKAWDKTMELTQPEEEITGEAPQAETQEL